MALCIIPGGHWCDNLLNVLAAIDDKKLRYNEELSMGKYNSDAWHDMTWHDMTWHDLFPSKDHHANLLFVYRAHSGKLDFSLNNSYAKFT
jgi:hypothetical protein